MNTRCHDPGRYPVIDEGAIIVQVEADAELYCQDHGRLHFTHLEVVSEVGGTQGNQAIPLNN